MNKMLKRALSLLICLSMILAYLPGGMLRATADDQLLDIIAGSKKADPSTMDGWKAHFGPEKLDTEFAGAVWTDKSVFTGATNELPGVTLTDKNNFLVALSAIAANLSITGHTSAPTDTMLVLDLSGSMVDDTYEVGTIRRNGNYRTAEGIDMAMIEAMIEATNITINQLMKQNTNNRVGVVLYSGNSSTNQAATAETATVVLPLGRYTGVDGEYLSVDTTWTTSTLYTRTWSGWQASGEATYVAEDTAINVSVKDGLKTDTGATVSDISKRVNGGTYIQNGLYKAMEQFLAVNDTVVPEGKTQAGVERMPVLVLMSDGAPTIATTDYANVDTSDTGTGSGTSDRITFLTQLTAAYVSGRVAAKYQENDTDKAEMLFLTLGLGTENSSDATNTLYPAGSNTTLQGYWKTYLETEAGSNATIISGNNELRVERDAAVAAMNYVDKYFYASDAEGLVNTFNEIVSEIELKAETYTTLVEGSNADFSGYVTFDDELGELMQVFNVAGIMIGDTLYTGKELAKGMTDGNLGTDDGPTASGDELVATVKERIPGITTTQAQQLIDNAYNDMQLYYAGDNNWSNYIGWYADANGNYVGFWDKESGYANAPEGAVYATRSYGYLGANGDSNMMHVVVMVRTELATLHQTVLFKIPATLLPTVQYRITLNESEPSKVEKFTQETAEPMRLVFEAGLRSDINSVNLDQKIKEHVAKGGHVHRNADGTVTFYTNQWKIGNDTNGNGIPDPEEVDTAVVTQSHFHPALDNTRFYYTDDTVIYTGNDSTVTGNTRPTDTDSNSANGTGYYYNRYIYSANGCTIIKTPIAATTLADDAKYDTANGYWYIPAGTMYHNLARFQTAKKENTTNTLGYSFFPAVFDKVSKQDVYSFLGNNGSITVAPATGIVLNKQVQGAIPGVSEYTFRVTLSGASAGAAAPVLTDSNGNALANVTLSALSNGQFTVTMPADVSAYISGIPVGTSVTVEELINGDYKVVDIEVAGSKQSVTAPAALTIPTYSENGSQMVNVTITNAPNGYGDLVISKDIVHNLESDPEAMAGKEFTFRVKLSGSKITAGMTFTTNENTTVTVGRDGYLTYADGKPITLKHDESVTIHRIPEGTTYTITEDALPGFQLDSINDDATATQASGVISANAENKEAFFNRYPAEFAPVEVPVTVDVSKILNKISPYTGNEEFVFVLQMLLPDGTYPNIAATNGSEYLKVGAGETEQGAFKLTFEDLGTYFFRVVELKPSEQTPAGADTPGMNYSTMQALFAVVVTDNDMDGVLEVAVREEAHVTVTPQYAGEDTEQIQGISVAATFTNNYQVHATNTGLNIHKTLNNNTGAVKPLTDFHFTVYPSDVNGNVAGGVQGTKITSSALGDATFNIFLDTAGTYHYKVSEDIPAGAVMNAQTGKYVLNGMSYDPSVYLYTVVAEVASDSNLVVTSRTLKNLTTGANVDPVNGVYTAAFVNDYELTSTNVELPFSKKLIGRAPVDGELYETYLVPTDSYFNPLTGALGNSYFIGGNDTSNVRLTFDKVGTYHYKWTEIAPTGATLNPVTGKYVLNGVSYDNAVYHITVTVSDNGAGVLSAQAVMHKVGAVDPVTSADFVNTYTVAGSNDVTIGGKKVLNGRKMVAGEFTIGLYSDVLCQEPIETTTNNADGTFAFSALKYTEADLGDGYAEKIYTYYIKEVPGNKGGVTYDPNVYTVTVKVGNKNGVLTVTPSDNAAALQISNTYEAEGVNVTLKGSKVLSGDWTSVVNKDFTFQLFQANSDFAITNSIPVKTATVNGNADFSMKLRYEDGQEGYYYFVLKEDLSVKAGGIGYDAGEYHITVNVSDPGNGRLIAMVSMYRPGTGNTTTALFTNAYSVEPVFVTLEGTKTYTNSLTNAPMGMDEGMFSFLVMEGDNLVSTGYNLADGTIKFASIRYTQAGVHTYTIVENVGDTGGITYDDAVFTVKVTVVDNGNGTLTATVDYNTPVAFENTYTQASAQVSFKGNKVLSGDWSNVPAANKIFNFELYETGSDFAISGNPSKYTSNRTDGSFTFGTLTYTTEGTHYYVILEQAGNASKGITYDSTKYNITVKVEDDGSGNLIPTVTATGATVTPDAQNSRLVTVSDLKFTNSYAATKPAQYTPEAQKKYEGDAMKEFDFILTVNGGKQQIKQNDLTTGKISFDTLTFDAAGIYEVKIREQENTLWGLIRWDTNVYTITLCVEDNGEGQLFVNESKTVIVSEKGRNDLEFRNVHHSIITDKDVFLYTEPSISIDDKAVEKNDILLYKISYTNYDSVPVDITITDAIPQYTSYVAGSADKGGVLIGDKLSWTLTQVAPSTTVTVSFQVKVEEVGGTVTNSATVLEGRNEYHTEETSNPVKEDTVAKDVFLYEDPNVRINGQAVEKGNILLYKITYTNADDSAADVTITDTIPQYTTYVDGSVDNGGIVNNGVITWTLKLEPKETKTVSFCVAVVGAKGQTISNQASAVEGENTVKTESITNPIEEDTLTKDVFITSDPKVSIDGKAVEKGDELQYKITYTNADGAKAKVTITDTIPQYTTYVDGSVDNGGVITDGVITWVFELEAGESKTVSFKVKVVGAKGETISNKASALEGNNTLETKSITNPIEEDDVEKNVFSSSDPTVKINGKVVGKGEELLYKITYTNKDGLPAKVTITDTIPQYTTYVDGSVDNGGVITDGVITWNLELDPGESKTVSFKVIVDGVTGQTVSNKASAVEGNNTVETEKITNAIEEDTVTKDVFLSSAPTTSIDGKEVAFGEVLVYTITYTNTDELPAKVTITDTIPQYTSYVDGSVDNGGTVADGVITWVLELGAGESKTVSFKVMVTGGEGKTVTNEATAQEGENLLTTNQVTTNVPNPPDMPDQTGDTMNMALYIGLMLSSVACLFVLVSARKSLIG